MKIKQKEFAGLILLTAFYLISFLMGPDPVTVIIMITIGYIIYSDFSLGVRNIRTVVFLIGGWMVYRVLLSIIMDASNMEFSIFHLPSVGLFLVIIIGFLISGR